MNGDVTRVRQLAAGWCYLHSGSSESQWNSAIPISVDTITPVRGLGDQPGSQECGNVAHCHNITHHHANTLYHHTSLTRIREVYSTETSNSIDNIYLYIHFMMLM